MAYLIDADVLITAKNYYYAFDICPGFWELLLNENAAGRVFSIDKIHDDLTKGNDKLTDWAQQHHDFFHAIDAPATMQVTRVSAAVMAGAFNDSEKRKFLQSSDLYLIGYALAYGHTIVTLEKYSLGASKPKIPNISSALSVPCIQTFEMLRNLGAEFILKNN